MHDRLMLPPPTPNGSAAVIWADLIDLGASFFLAGLRTDFGPERMEAEYRVLEQRERAERDRRLEQMLTNLSRREACFGR